MEPKAAIKTDAVVKVTLHQNITRDDLHKSLDRILKFYGCPDCGFNGWGLDVRVINPATSKLRDSVVTELNNPIVNVEEFDVNAGRF